jgi:hypothetical protein
VLDVVRKRRGRGEEGERRWSREGNVDRDLANCLQGTS